VGQLRKHSASAARGERISDRVRSRSARGRIRRGGRLGEREGLRPGDQMVLQLCAAVAVRANARLAGDLRVRREAGETVCEESEFPVMVLGAHGERIRARGVPGRDDDERDAVQLQGAHARRRAGATDRGAGRGNLRCGVRVFGRAVQGARRVGDFHELCVRGGRARISDFGLDWK